MRASRTWLRLPALLLLAAVAAAGLVPAAPRPAGAQASTVVTLIHVGDISPPTNEPRGDDYATSELALLAGADLVCVEGDAQYEYGAGAMFTSPVGYEGSWGRLRGRTRCPAEGNHDAADPGPGSPGFRAYFADQLARADCTQDSPPCRPDLGYWAFNLANGWRVRVLNSNCGRFGGGTGDVETPSCAGGSPQVTWLQADVARWWSRKCTLAVWHHERWGTGFFADDPATAAFWSALNHGHNDLILNGHTHSVARMGPMTVHGTVSSIGAGQRQLTAGTGGRSLTPWRVEPARVGTRYRANSRYGFGRLELAGNPDGSGGSWTNEFWFVGGGRIDRATAGCWI